MNHLSSGKEMPRWGLGQFGEALVPHTSGGFIPRSATVIDRVQASSKSPQTCSWHLFSLTHLAIKAIQARFYLDLPLIGKSSCENGLTQSSLSGFINKSKVSPNLDNLLSSWLCRMFAYRSMLMLKPFFFGCFRLRFPFTSFKFKFRRSLI